MIALVGATATGKTAVGEALAARLGAEVVCADSRQVFAELDVGTGKPTAAERAARPHHLFDALALGERGTAGWYAQACATVVADIHARGRRPLLVGGSGLYVEAAREGLAAVPPIDPAVRERIATQLDAEGPEALHERLARVDPVTAARLAPRDRQRVSRALEVWEGTGQPLSWWHTRPRSPASARWRVIELTARSEHLDAAIAARTNWMFDHGLVDETRELLAAKRGPALRALRAIGYDEAIALLEGTLDRPTAERRTTLRTRQLAKRQRTWFRNRVEAIRIPNDEMGLDEITKRVIEAIEA